MKDFRRIALFALLIGAVPFFTQSGVVLNFVMTALYACLLSQAWNVLGGFGGQFSFGHALFFGTGAYVQAIAQMQWGLSPWVALPLAMVFAAGVGAFVGAASFRYGLKGSYFALVTLAFAEVFRIVATSVPFTGAGVGLMLPLKESAANMQFVSRAGFIWLMLGLVTLALCVTAWLKASRFGAYLQAVRDNEDAARAIGVNPFQVKLVATILSVRFMCRSSSTSIRALPLARTPRSRPWWARSWAAWAPCGARSWGRSVCTSWPMSRAICSVNCRASTWSSTAWC